VSGAKGAKASKQWTRRASEYLQTFSRDTLFVCSNRIPTYVVAIHVTCTLSGAQVGSVGCLAGADKPARSSRLVTTRLVTQETAQTARLRHRKGSTNQREDGDRP
jgi:hypothetical protein